MGRSSLKTLWCTKEWNGRYQLVIQAKQDCKKMLTDMVVSKFQKRKGGKMQLL
jgi:hypothetical protein